MSSLRSRKRKAGEADQLSDLSIVDILSDKHLAKHSEAFREKIRVEQETEEKLESEAPVLPEDMLTKVDKEGNTQGAGDHVGVRIVNGEIVIDESTLSYDQSNVEMLDSHKIEHESGRTKSHRKKVPVRTRWTKLDIDEFYLMLRKYGTDFDLISQSMTKFTRRQIKKRFLIEEKNSPEKIDYAMSHPLPFGMFSKFSNP